MSQLTEVNKLAEGREVNKLHKQQDEQPDQRKQMEHEQTKQPQTKKPTERSCTEETTRYPPKPGAQSTLYNTYAGLGCHIVILNLTLIPDYVYIL